MKIIFYLNLVSKILSHARSLTIKAEARTEDSNCWNLDANSIESDIAEALASTKKYEWIVVDIEHGSHDFKSLTSICRAIELYNVLPFARLRTAEKMSAKEVSEIGFAGYIVPMIENKAQITDIYKSVNYPPKGSRGVGFCRSNQYGENFKLSLNQESPILVAMIETQKGVENIREILDSGVVDAIMVGPYDLSASYGITGDFENKLFNDKLKEIKDICLEKIYLMVFI